MERDLIGLHRVENLLERESLPRRTWLRVRAQRLYQSDSLKRMKETTAAKVDLVLPRCGPIRATIGLGSRPAWSCSKKLGRSSIPEILLRCCKA